MAQDALTTIGFRNDFYRDNYRRVVGIVLLSIIVNISLLVVLLYLLTHPPKPVYFPTSVNGRITPLFPLNKANQSDAAVLQWANQAAIATYTYNFVNYRQELQAASEFFTPRGWTEFLNALKGSNNLDAVKQKKMVVSAVATKAPIILKKGLYGNRFAWRVQMPLLVTYQSTTEFVQDSVLVTVLITRISSLNAPRGIGIEQLIVQPIS